MKKSEAEKMRYDYNDSYKALFVKINVEKLIDMVQEYFDEYGAYSNYCKVPYSKHDEKWNSEYRYYERNFQVRDYCITDICVMLNVNRTRLECVARLARKWEAKHNWLRCFPVEDHAGKILNFIAE